MDRASARQACTSDDGPTVSRRDRLPRSVLEEVAQVAEVGNVGDIGQELDVANLVARDEFEVGDARVLDVNDEGAFGFLFRASGASCLGISRIDDPRALPGATEEHASLV